MTVKQDYFLDDVLKGNYSDYDELFAFINHKMYLGLADSDVQNNDFGCSSFLARTPEGDYIAGRNYDYSDELVLYTNPDNGFASISMTELRAMDVLESISQSGEGYPTQWSAVYNLNQYSMDIALDRNYDKVYHFTAEDFK